MAQQVLHVSGFANDGEARDVRVARYDGTLADISRRVLAEVESHGHQVTVQTVRTLGGDLREVHATTTVAYAPMWHVFTTTWSDPWPLATLD